MLVLCRGELQLALADCSTHAAAEYRRTPSPQANKTAPGVGMANFLFPGIMGHKKLRKDDENEKLFSYATHEEGKSP